jgi:FMN phosphatase YigB (HAD superfamily)
VRWDPRTLYSKIFPDPVERDWFLNHVCTMDWHVAHDLGSPFAETRPALIARFPEHEAAILAWGDRWWEMFSGPISETEAAMDALHAAQVPQFALTNMATHTWPGTRAMSPAFGRLKGVVVSGEEGMAKPDPAIFRLVCERFGYRPEEMLFVDDVTRNIAAAAALGFATHLFDDPKALMPALEAHGLL